MPIQTGIGTIVSICTSEKIGTAKDAQTEGELIGGLGLAGDGHAGTDRQISLLMSESVDAFNEKFGLKAKPGDFAENLQTRGINFQEIPVGTKIIIGNGILEVTQIGKATLPHHYSYYGHRLLPSEGVFCRVVTGGRIKPGDVVCLEGHAERSLSLEAQQPEKPSDEFSRKESARKRWEGSPRSKGLFKEFTEPWFDPKAWHFDNNGTLRGTFCGEKCHEGFAGIVHGGVISALADAAMTHCLFGHDVSAFTAELNVRFRRPLFVGKEAEICTTIQKQIGSQIFHITTKILQEGILRAEAQGTFFRPTAGDPGYDDLAGAEPK